jgi:hypothetical protein
MKLFSLFAFAVVFSFSASAYTTLNCSNAKGTVIWNKGESNKITLTYRGFVTGQLELDVDQVIIQSSNEKIISEVNKLSCGAHSMYSKTYVTDVVVTPSEKSPNVFQSYFPKPEIKTTVLCEYFTTTRMNCSEE